MGPAIPLPGTVPAPSNVTFPTSTLWVVLPPNMKPTSMVEWNFSYQHQFAADWLASASYVGNKTSHLWLGSDRQCGHTRHWSRHPKRRPEASLYLARPAMAKLIGSLLQVGRWG